jgi:sporulation protein YlmC with PRC-barrel domain
MDESHHHPFGMTTARAPSPRVAPMRLELGKTIQCSDREVGELADLVIDPTTRQVTHLVVRMHAHEGPARLVPVDLVENSSADDGITLRCPADDLNSFDVVDRFAYVRTGDFPVEDPRWDVGVSELLMAPYYEATGLGEYPGAYDPNTGVAYDRIPKGEAEIRRSSEVTTKDGAPAGRVDGFVVDGEQHITHFVLERGHLWGKREVTIPIGAVERIETDAVTLSLTKDEIGALPAARVHRWL